MTQFLARLFTAAFVSCALAGAAGQSVSKACPAPPAVLASTQPNIFSEQQEQWLGDAMADQIERFYRPVRDPAENAYLAQIAKRLLAALPPTTIQFRVILVDSDEVNGFSLAGGRVYLTRKLVANAKNEDEVASVIGHEMGHILSHQFAIETTADLKRLLGVTSVSDKADIYAKFQRLVDASMTDKHPGPSGDSDEKQNEADTVAVYATAAAGYRPQAYAEFWDRMFFVNGKVGGTLSDFFGTTKPEQKRLRAISKLVAALPPGCGAGQETAGPEFDHWRNLVVANQAATVEADAKPVAEVTLTPPLRMDLEQLRFSRDGRYVLAQDESSIWVLTRDPFKLLFRFDAEKALPAEFSPDSQRIVFNTMGLHTEEWSVAEQKLVASHEPVARQECLQSEFAPDGRTLFCTSIREDDDGVYLDLAMLDVASGQVLFQKKDFFDPTYAFLIKLALSERSSAPIDVMPSSLSADGNIFVIGPSNKKLAFDLRTRTPIGLGGDFKNLIDGPYAFLSNDRVVGIDLEGGKGSGVFSFPDGKRMEKVPFEVSDLHSVTSGNYVLTHTFDDYAVGLADVSAGKFVVASHAPSMDVWDGWLLNENPDGSVLLHRIDKTAADQKAVLAPGPLASGIDAAISADGKLLAFSTRTRGGIWNLDSGERVIQYVHFNSGVFAADNSFYAEFPKSGKQERGIAHFQFGPLSTGPVSYKEDDAMRLTDGMLQEWKPSGKKAAELIVHDVRDNSVLWRRTFDAGEPAHTANIIPGTTILSFPLKADFAKSRTKADGTLGAQAAAVKNRDAGRLIQVLDDENGKLLHEVVLEVPATYVGVQGINIVGDELYLSSDDNRTMVYVLATGAQLRQLFGYVISADNGSGRVCTVNRRDEAVVYDAKGQQLADFHMGIALRFAAFKTGTAAPGSRLLLLTADQKMRTMEVPSAPAQ